MEKTKIAKPEKDKLELHELLQRIALIVGFVAIFVAIIATNARNEGCFTIRYSKDTGNLLYTLFVFSAKSESIKIAFLTPKLTSVLAASLSVASLGLTGASNIINRKFKKTDYIVGGFEKRAPSGGGFIREKAMQNLYCLLFVRSENGYTGFWRQNPMLAVSMDNSDIPCLARSDIFLFGK